MSYFILEIVGKQSSSRKYYASNTVVFKVWVWSST